MKPRRAVIALLSVTALAPVVGLGTICTGRRVEMQVLGSGGPGLEDKRASSSYLVWQAGQPRVLVDSGGAAHCASDRPGRTWRNLNAILFTHWFIPQWKARL